MIHKQVLLYVIVSSCIKMWDGQLTTMCLNIHFIFLKYT